jgi:hypothetical protein
LKGVGATFTPYLAAAMRFMAITYKPRGEYETIYQIVTGPLLDDPRVNQRARPITYVPAFSWATFAVVLMPVKPTTHGRRVLDDLQKLEPHFPNYKAFVEWDPGRHQHVVRYQDLTAQESGVIAKVECPGKEDILNALQGTAFDNLDALVAANDDISTVVRSREVS